MLQVNLIQRFYKPKVSRLSKCQSYGTFNLGSATVPWVICKALITAQVYCYVVRNHWHDCEGNQPLYCPPKKEEADMVKETQVIKFEYDPTNVFIKCFPFWLLLPRLFQIEDWTPKEVLSIQWEISLEKARWNPWQRISLILTAGQARGWPIKTCSTCRSEAEWRTKTKKNRPSRKIAQAMDMIFNVSISNADLPINIHSFYSLQIWSSSNCIGKIDCRISFNFCHSLCLLAPSWLCRTSHFTTHPGISSW